jgi:hypothetical protein
MPEETFLKRKMSGKDELKPSEAAREGLSDSNSNKNQQDLRKWIPKRKSLESITEVILEPCFLIGEKIQG